jgi:hypothetical protein
MGRTSQSQVTFDVTANASNWILVTATSRCGFLVPVTSRLEFQQSSPTVEPGILVITNVVGTST